MRDKDKENMTSKGKYYRARCVKLESLPKVTGLSRADADVVYRIQEIPPPVAISVS